MRTSRPRAGPRSASALTLPEAALAVGLSVTTLRRHIRNGRLRAARVPGKYGDEYRITPAELATLGLPVRAPRPPSPASPRAPSPDSRSMLRAAGHLAAALEPVPGELAALRRELRELRRALTELSRKQSRGRLSSPR